MINKDQGILYFFKDDNDYPQGSTLNFAKGETEAIQAAGFRRVLRKPLLHTWEACLTKSADESNGTLKMNRLLHSPEKTSMRYCSTMTMYLFPENGK